MKATICEGDWPVGGSPVSRMEVHRVRGSDAGTFKELSSLLSRMMPNSSLQRQIAEYGPNSKVIKPVVLQVSKQDAFTRTIRIISRRPGAPRHHVRHHVTGRHFQVVEIEKMEMR